MGNAYEEYAEPEPARRRIFLLPLLPPDRVTSKRASA